MRFCVIFFACILGFTGGYLFLRKSSMLNPFLIFNTDMAALILKSFGELIQTDSTTIFSGNSSFRVISECTSIVPTGIFVSAVIAWQSSSKEKLTGIIMGTIVLFIINMIRIITLFYIGTNFPRFFEVAHYFLWQGLVVLTVLGLWLLWTEKIVSTKY